MSDERPKRLSDYPKDENGHRFSVLWREDGPWAVEDVHENVMARCDTPEEARVVMQAMNIAADFEELVDRQTAIGNYDPPA